MLKRQIAALTKPAGHITDVCWGEYARAAPFLKEFLDERNTTRPVQITRVPEPVPCDLAAA